MLLVLLSGIIRSGEYVSKSRLYSTESSALKNELLVTVISTSG